MKMYYLKMLLFTFLINTLVVRHYEYYLNNHYNVSLIQNKTKRATIKSRLLSQTQNHNPHYHSDPELKKIIDQLNEEAIKKYQENHDPYEQLQDVVEKKRTNPLSGQGAEPMSTIEKDLLEAYEETFGNEKNIMLKSDMNPNDDRSDKSSTCDCTDTNNMKLETGKGKDKYLKHLKGRCTRGICVCSVGSTFLTLMGLALAKKAAFKILNVTVHGVSYSKCASSLSIFHMLDGPSILASGTACSSDLTGTAAVAAMNSLYPWGIAALVLLILTVILIILYIWLYRRRKNSWKHECKKHLCK
ncbi:stevor isoform troph beta [Plasmodium falciparum Dd2]|uniref:Stevor isoform troph beta n=1 Tax=Plasmodium falciparum (isolate Dd2) TaxID=57267 RepID=A0A0L7LXX6_PLAF4|nr:stevor isoform troph beta [Plasmodium falciparum Dd2]